MSKELTLFLIKDEFWQRRDEAFQNHDHVVYVIFSDKPVHRALGIDSKGILYIGAARKVGRLVQLLATVRDNSKTHKFGIRYKSNPEFQNQYPVESLQVRLIPTDNPFVLERQKLSDYEKQFGELPPFNRGL